MTTTVSPPQGPASSSGAPSAGGVDRSVYDAIAQLPRSCRSKDELYRQALRLLAGQFNAPFAALRIERAGNTFWDQYAASDDAAQAWSKTADGLMLTSRYQRTAKAKLFHSSSAGLTLAAFSAPLAEGEEGVVGSVFIATPCRGREQAEDLLRELQAMVALIGMAAQSLQPGKGATSGQGSVESFAKASQFKSLREMAFAICHNLKNKLGCEQVALGLVRDNRVDVLCISGFDELYPRSPGAQALRQAMCECFDARQRVCFPPLSEPTLSAGRASGVSFRHRLHEQWHDGAGHASVASIPLFVGDEPAAILSLRNPQTNPFRADQLDKLAELVAPFAPGLLLMEKASRSAARHVWESICDTGRRLLGEGGRGRKGIAAVVALGLAWVVLGRRDYVVSAPCTLIPSEVRQITAPYDATLAAAFVHAGDEVRQGDLLVRLDTRQLTTERKKLLAEVEISRLEGTQAAAAKNLSLAAQADAARRMAEAQLQAVDARIAQSEIRAPSDGTILSGELTEKLGEVAPMGTLLLEFAPRNAWRVDVQLPEHAAPYVLQGQAGVFALSARPDEQRALKVARVKPSSEVAEGRNVFVVETTLEGDPPAWVRAGMRGSARVNTGPQPVWWVWLHRAIDEIRLALWKL